MNMSLKKIVPSIVYAGALLSSTSSMASSKSIDVNNLLVSLNTAASKILDKKSTHWAILPLKKWESVSCSLSVSWEWSSEVIGIKYSSDETLNYIVKTSSSVWEILFDIDRLNSSLSISWKKGFIEIWGSSANNQNKNIFWWLFWENKSNSKNKQNVPSEKLEELTPEEVSSEAKRISELIIKNASDISCKK